MSIESKINDFLDGKEFIQAIPLLNEWGATGGIGVFYQEIEYDAGWEPTGITQYKEFFYGIDSSAEKVKGENDG